MSVKPFCSYGDQIALLESRGLDIPDHTAAQHLLQHHNYYRLSAYRFPFESAKDQFASGATLDDLWQLYRFDRGLRLLVGEACKSLEISVRARWAYVLGEHHGAMAYENPAVFRNVQRHTQQLVSLDREISRSHEVFISHHRNTYQMLRPPIWAACEVMSFGLLSRFYENMKQTSLQKKISQSYQLSAPGLTSLLLHATYLRNLCAHHSRLWNRSLTITVALPTRQPASLLSSLNTDPSAERLVYNSLVLLGHIMNTVSVAPDWTQRLKAHLQTLNRPDHSEMGFPNGWEELPFWK